MFVAWCKRISSWCQRRLGALPLISFSFSRRKILSLCPSLLTVCGITPGLADSLRELVGAQVQVLVKLVVGVWKVPMPEQVVRLLAALKVAKLRFIDVSLNLACRKIVSTTEKTMNNLIWEKLLITSKKEIWTPVQPFTWRTCLRAVWSQKSRTVWKFLRKVLSDSNNLVSLSIWRCLMHHPQLSRPSRALAVVLSTLTALT